MKIRRTVAISPDGTVHQTAGFAGQILEDREEVWDGPCQPWPIDPTCCPGWPDDPADWTPVQRAAAEIATDILWRATAGRYGLCEEVVRPCRTVCADPGLFGGPLLSPYIDDGRWFNRACGCTTGCHCGTLCTVALPGPVAEVVEVKLDGNVITDWALHRRPGLWELVRTGISAPWPLGLTVTSKSSDPTGMSVIAQVDNAGLGPVDSLDFGDGTEFTDVPENTGTPHTYANPGTYLVQASDEAEPGPCVPVPPLSMTVDRAGSDPSGMSVTVNLDNGGLGPIDKLVFGDGTTATDVPENTDLDHTYTTAGTYKLIATDDAVVPPCEDTGACWPVCQNLLLPDSEPDTFSVRYLRGKPVPAAGIMAVSALACEIAKQCSGAKGCRLPERVKTVQREGITYEMIDTGEWLDKGRTGLNEVDRWLASVNPRGVRTPPAVYSLDLPAAPLIEGRYAPRGGAR